MQLGKKWKHKGKAKKETGGMDFDQFSEHKETMISCVKGKDTILISPILYWTKKDVWEFLNKIGVPHCSLYDNGYERIGCVFCPMSNVHEMLEYPFKYKHWTKRLKDVISELCKEGCYQKLNSDPDLVFAWYLSKRSIADFKKNDKSNEDGYILPE